jgi:hypothetical protein
VPASASAPKAPVERVHEATDSDKEDGEVSDADGNSRAPAAIAMRQRYPEPPRSVPQATAAPPRAEDAYNPDKPSAGQMARQPAAKDAPQAGTPVNEVDLVQQQREEAKQFIRLLNAHNIGYRALAKENVDVDLLRGMYRSMNLPSEPEPIPPPKTNGAGAPGSQTSTAAPSIPRKTVPPVATNVTVAQSAAPSPVDRKDYLARLQAAKLARQSGPAKADPPQNSPPAAVASPATGVSTPQATTTPTRKPPVTDEQKARQTELIKQRLEALKAQSKQTATSSITAPKPVPLQNAVQQPRTPASGTSAPPTPAASFPGIPGLFMNTVTGTINGSSTPSRQPQAVPQKRPAPSDTSVSTPRGSVTPYNRTFGQSPQMHQEESMIIEVSDDETNGSDMDIDDDQAPAGPTSIRQAPVSIPGFPPRQISVPTAASAVSTPGPQTPATLARTGELSTKEQELAALKMTLKKKLAEQKRIKEEAAAAAAAAALGKTPQAPPSKPAEAASSSISADTIKAKPTQSTLPHGDFSRDRKRRRRTEIQEQLPSLDDEIANNEAEMARLAKDLERLKSNNERVMQDKQRLMRELEDLGIDTEGMSHADMKATKDEIERAKSPEVENTLKGAKVLTLGTALNEESSASTFSLVDKPDVTANASVDVSTSAPVDSQPVQSQYGFLPGLGQSASNMLGSTVHPSVSESTQELRSSPNHDSLRIPGSGKSVEAPPQVGSGNDRASATPMDDEEDFYSPPPPVVEETSEVAPPVVHPSTVEVEQSDVPAPSSSEEGEIEMSESSEEDDEEDYEPEEPTVGEPTVEQPAVGEPSVTESSLKDTDVGERVAAYSIHQDRLLEPLVERPHSLGQSQVSTEDEEVYEPPDVDEEMTEDTPEVDVTQPAATQSELSSLEDVDDGAMDIATSSSDESDGSESDSDSDSDEGSQVEPESAEASPRAAQPNTNIANDLAFELQPQNSAITVPAAELSHNVSFPPTMESPLTTLGRRCQGGA